MAAFEVITNVSFIITQEWMRGNRCREGKFHYMQGLE